jgi:hypothetical protein
MAGGHGLGKSAGALAMACSVATGHPWLGHPVVQGRAVYITAEDDRLSLQARIRAWLAGVPDDERTAAEEALGRNLHVLTREDFPAGLPLTTASYSTAQRHEPLVDQVVARCEGASLIVMETVARLHCAPETNEAYAVFAQAIESIARRTGAAVVVVHHVSKAGAREGTTDSYSSRGGASLVDAARSVIVVTGDPRDPEGRLQIGHAKSTHSRTVDSISARRVSVPEVDSFYVALAPAEDGAAKAKAADAPEARDREVVHAYVAAFGAAGVTAKEIRESPPGGIPRKRTEAALDALVSSARLTKAKDPDRREGGRGPAPVVYRAAPAPEVLKF